MVAAPDKLLRKPSPNLSDRAAPGATGWGARGRVGRHPRQTGPGHFSQREGGGAMTAQRPDGEQRQDQASPPGQRPRRRAYFVMMGTCLVLFICSWAFVWRLSLVAAVIMSAVA